jgi:hypothetical protein
MLFVDLIAESKIAEAARAGAFDNLPGAGRPLDLDFDRMVPEDVRIAYRILRNSGFLPPELEARREAANLRSLQGPRRLDARRSLSAQHPRPTATLRLTCRAPAGCP